VKEWAFGLVLVACASAPPPPLRQSCETRAAWKNSSAQTCTVCVAETMRPRCDCDTSPAAGACIDETRAMNASADCGQPIADCVTACKGDCTCTDACYQGHMACQAAAASLQACIVKACDERCR
jgi:hypothetical protein